MAILQWDILSYCKSDNCYNGGLCCAMVKVQDSVLNRLWLESSASPALKPGVLMSAWSVAMSADCGCTLLHAITHSDRGKCKDVRVVTG